MGQCHTGEQTVFECHRSCQSRAIEVPSAHEVFWLWPGIGIRPATSWRLRPLDNLGSSVLAEHPLRFPMASPVSCEIPRRTTTGILARRPSDCSTSPTLTRGRGSCSSFLHVFIFRVKTRY